jgi:hypothetical protein
LWLPFHLMNKEVCAYEHFNKFNYMAYEKNKFNLQTHFKEHIMFVNWGLLVLCWKYLRNKHFQEDTWQNNIQKTEFKDQSYFSEFFVTLPYRLSFLKFVKVLQIYFLFQRLYTLFRHMSRLTLSQFNCFVCKHVERSHFSPKQLLSWDF